MHVRAPQSFRDAWLGWGRLAAGAAFVAATACSSFDGLGPRDPQECGHARPPARPTSAPGGGSHQFAVAARTYDFGDSVDGLSPREIGYDLDNTCTFRATEATCKPPRWRTVEPTDGLLGRDNAGGALFAQVTESDPSKKPRLTEAANANSENGKGTAVIVVGAFNGEQDDDQVEVAVYAATTATSIQEWNEDKAPSPAWEGSDPWRAFEEWIELDEADAGQTAVLTDRAKYRDPDAYVSHGTLVATFEELRTIGSVLSLVTMTAHLKPSSDKVSAEPQWALTEGIFAGRQRADDLLASLGEAWTDRRCTNSADYQGLKELFCSYADIDSAGNDDRSVECDGVSWGWRFDAEPATLAGVVGKIQDTLVLCPSACSPRTDRCDAQTKPCDEALPNE